ncbi:MAG: CoA transferase [Gammaproteobacteria bacterium]|nr:CoA transferase [Gammaproteobacteria bacterium]
MKKTLLSHYESNILKGPLNGIVVVGLCYYVAGPVALQNLVRQGALVIKVERKPLGDPSRYVFSPAIFNSLTYGQLSLAIDSDNEKDEELLEKLLNTADVIVDNRSVRAKENDKLLQLFLQSDKANPTIYCSIDGYPEAKTNRLPGLDAAAQACTGLAYSNCSSPNTPLKVGIAVLDKVTGLLATNYIMSNLYLLTQRTLPSSTKNVINIAVSLVGTSAWLQTNQYLNAIEGHEYLRTGNKDNFAAPFSYYTAQDGLLSIATVNESQFKKFCTDVLKDPDFHNQYPTISQRIENQENFERDLNKKLKTKDRKYWLTECKKHQIPAAPVLTVSQALEQGFIRNLISSTTDGKPIITDGAEHTLFPLAEPLPAPKVDQDREGLFNVFLKSNL